MKAEIRDKGYRMADAGYGVRLVSAAFSTEAELPPSKAKAGAFALQNGGEKC